MNWYRLASFFVAMAIVMSLFVASVVVVMNVQHAATLTPGSFALAGIVMMVSCTRKETNEHRL